jgi:hypothetical protein
MKITTLLGTAILLALFGTAAPAFAQEQHEQQEPPKQDAKPPHEDPKQQEPPKTPNDQPHPDNKAAKPPRNEQPKTEQSRTERSSGKSQQRIPDDKFRAHFGREHSFHIGHPVAVEGRPRFQYGGYSFFISQPWPAGWSYDDEVYIVEVDGAYYLVDLAHPGIQLALVIAL